LPPLHVQADGAEDSRSGRRHSSDDILPACDSCGDETMTTMCSLEDRSKPPRELDHVRMRCIDKARGVELASTHQTVACCCAHANLANYRQLMSRACRQLQTTFI